MAMAKKSTWLSSRTFVIAFIIFVLLGSGIVVFRMMQTPKNASRYVIGTVVRDTIITSMSGTGQVSASNQFDIKPTVSGTVIGIDVVQGKHVQSHEVLMRLDAKEAVRVVRDARVSLDSARLALKKLQQPPDKLSLLQAENAVIQAENAKQKAQEDLESALIALEKLSKPADELSLLQAQNALSSAQESYTKSVDDLKKARQDGFNEVADAFLNFPTIMTGMNDMFFVSTIDRNQMNIDWYANQITRWEAEKAVRYKNDLTSLYTSAKDHYEQNFEQYKASSRASEPKTLEGLIEDTYETSKLVSDCVKAANNYIDLVQNILKTYSYSIPSIVATHKNTLTTYTNLSNASATKLFSIRQSIDNAKTSITSSQRSVGDKTESLKKLQEGTDPLDIKSQQLVISQRRQAIIDTERSIAEKKENLTKLKEGADLLDIQSQQLVVTQREHALEDAQEKLNDYTIRAPFEGDVAAIPIHMQDAVSPSSTLATLITRKRIAEISLNEIDAAKVSVGQKATLEFDAVEELSISGSVMEIDTVGTVSQGVVSYIVKIAFDIQDDRVKPGMTVNAVIATDRKQNILAVPNGAVKSTEQGHYVEVPSSAHGAKSNELPRRQIVEIGISNDQLTEIISGLNEGDRVVVRTIAAQAQQQQAPSLFAAPGSSGGLRSGQGGSFRMQGTR